MNPKLTNRAAVCVWLLLVTILRAEDYKSAHHVEPGDVISAEVINELFDKVAESERTFTADDLVGTWKGGAYGPYLTYGTPGWFNDPANSCWALSNATVTISKISSNYYQLTTGAPDPFCSKHTNAWSNRIAVIEGTLFGIEAQVVYTIDRIGPNRIRLTSHNVWSEYSKLLTLDRQNTPPEKPKLVSADVSGGQVALTWKDNSDDEAGFNVLRKDSLSGDYTIVTTVPADATSWTNSALSSGIYWYRIASTNSNGSSLGSNVKRVVVP